MPPDKVMGVYRDVTVSSSGPVTLRHPQVVTTLPGSSLDRAELTVKVFARNATAAPVDARVAGRIGTIAFERRVSLGAGESREVAFSPAEFPQLVLRTRSCGGRPSTARRRCTGSSFEALLDGRVSDRAVSQFGIREFTSEMTREGHLLFKVNGRPILIRGAGYTPELMLRSSRERQEAEIRYVKDMGLNTIRLEGKLEDDHFFDVTRPRGHPRDAGLVLLRPLGEVVGLAGDDLPVATASLRDQILRLRGRASVFVWLNGSDGPPPANVERAYLAVLKELGFPNPVVSSATEKKAEHSGESGMKMRGPYDWVPPVYWYTDTKLGGPHGFATEIGPGPSPPPLESLKRFLPPDALWPVNDTWSYHCGGGPFKNLSLFNAALDARYGPSTRVEEYARKAQVPPTSRTARCSRASARTSTWRPASSSGCSTTPGQHDLAPVRLLPAAGRLVLRREEGLRAAARAVLLRRRRRARGELDARRALGPRGDGAGGDARRRREGEPARGGRRGPGRCRARADGAAGGRACRPPTSCS